MSLKNCKRCGKLFNFRGYTYNVCHNCLEKDNADFERIRQYILTHPYVSVLELSQETGVDPAVINRFHREGRFITREKPENLLCTECGAPVHTGQLCKECAAQKGPKNKQ